MRQTKSLPAPRWSLVRRVLAGCRQSLLGDGPSRHYLCNPCVGAWTHTPPRLSSALAHSFLESTGLTPRKMRSAREIVPAMQRQQGAVFRGCSHSFIFRLLRSLGPQIASTAASSCWAAGPFTPRIARVVVLAPFAVGDVTYPLARKGAYATEQVAGAISGRNLLHRNVLTSQHQQRTAQAPEFGRHKRSRS